MSKSVRRSAPREKGAVLYVDLIARFPPPPFRSRPRSGVKNRQLPHDPVSFTQGETDYLDELTDLIANHENIRYPVQDVSGVEVLRSLLNEPGGPQAEVPGSARDVAVNDFRDYCGKRDSGRKYIEAFSQYFCVSSTTFLRH